MLSYDIKSEFNIGDIVKIASKEVLEQCSDKIVYFPKKGEYANKIAKITAVKQIYSTKKYFYEIDIDDGYFNWNVDMFVDM